MSRKKTCSPHLTLLSLLEANLDRATLLLRRHTHSRLTSHLRWSHLPPSEVRHQGWGNAILQLDGDVLMVVAQPLPMPPRDPLRFPPLLHQIATSPPIADHCLQKTNVSAAPHPCRFLIPPPAEPTIVHIHVGDPLHVPPRGEQSSPRILKPPPPRSQVANHLQCPPHHLVRIAQLPRPRGQRLRELHTRHRRHDGVEEPWPVPPEIPIHDIDHNVRTPPRTHVQCGDLIAHLAVLLGHGPRPREEIQHPLPLTWQPPPYKRPPRCLRVDTQYLRNGPRYLRSETQYLPSPRYLRN